MSETRCAIPELLLDVDVLKLEYLLHNGIKAQLDAAKLRNNGRNGQKLGVSTDADDAVTRTREVFAIFYQYFQQAHPEHVLEPGRSQDMTLLEALILLESVQAGTHMNDGLLSRLDETEEIRDYHQRRSQIAQSQRSDGTILLSSSKKGKATEKSIQEIVQNFFHRNIDTYFPSETSGHLPIFRLLHRFMILSARIVQQLPEKDINDKWMQPAGELILHASLEALQATLSQDDSVNTPSTIPGILDCFAFQFSLELEQFHQSDEEDARMEVQPFDPAALEEELAINSMFKPQAETWNHIRSTFLSEFLLPESVASDSASVAEAYRRRIPRLHRKFPLQNTLRSIFECLDNLWAINTSSDISGKPVLVQIEEGALEGLDEQEFEAFSERVGLRRELDGFLEEEEEEGVDGKGKQRAAE